MVFVWLDYRLVTQLMDCLFFVRMGLFAVGLTDGAITVSVNGLNILCTPPLRTEFDSVFNYTLLYYYNNHNEGCHLINSSNNHYELIKLLLLWLM